ncbi:MAG: chloride channel protein, partial [Gemmatimonadaceae bacterium]|nr:chloride channel protein [Gemmatimonadaceae bacterium]
GQLGVRVLLALCVVKLVATVFSYSSGGAGGIFAPSLFIGAMLGGAAGHLDVYLLGHDARQVGAFALVGMGAVFAGVVRAPITSVLIIFEMTGGYGLVLPLMLANMTSYILARRMRPVPIYDALLAQDGIVLPHASLVPQGGTATRTPLPKAPAAPVRALVVPGGTRLAELAAKLLDADVEAFLVRRPEGGYDGVLAEQVHELARDADLANILVAADVMHAAVLVDEGSDLGELASALAREHVELAVVIDRETGAPHGVVTRTAVARAFLEWHTGRHRASQPARERDAGQESER